MTPGHFVLTPVGSSGDVHPFIGIGRGLRARGHRVTVVTSEPFREVTERAGLGFVQTHSAEEFDLLSRHPDLWHQWRGARLVLRTAAQAMRVQFDRVERLYEPGRTVLVGHLLAFGTRMFEDVHGAPAATLHLAPSAFRSLHVPPAHAPGADASRWPRPVKRAVWWALDRLVIDRQVVPELNAWRSEHGLAPVTRVFKDWVHSPRRVVGLFPAWFAPPQPDWPRQLRLTGFPLYDEREQHAVSPALDAFLAGGEAPILFTPGTANRAAAAFFEAGLEAARRLGRRALLLTPYAGQLPRPLPPSARHEAFVPLSYVLPRCAAIVHHGGIGTCAQGIAAGTPQIVMPLGFDQPDNVTRLARLGVGTWLRRSRFTAPALAATLDRLLADAGTAAACRRLAAEVRRQDAIAEACGLLEPLLPTV